MSDLLIVAMPGNVTYVEEELNFSLKLQSFQSLKSSPNCWLMTVNVDWYLQLFHWCIFQCLKMLAQVNPLLQNPGGGALRENFCVGVRRTF